MLYAVISDIHSNLQAWNAVLLDIRSRRIDRIICLGDIIGYGPDPGKVLSSVHSNVDYLTLGNHDAVLCGKMDASLFNDSARRMIFWTRKKLNNNAVRFLDSLPLALSGRDFRCTHGDFSNPAAYNYVIDPEDAAPSWETVGEQLLFVGHTHCPAIFVLGRSGTPHRIDPCDFELEPEKRYIVNTGSVGQPRGGGAQACYCVYDDSARTVSWRFVPFDLDAYRTALADAGISDESSQFLRYDPRLDKTPLRDVLDFCPASRPEETVQNAVEVQELTKLQRKVTRWKLLTGAVAACLLVAGSVTALAWWRHSNRAVDIACGTMPSIRASTVPCDRNLLQAPEESVADRSGIPGWWIHLGDRKRQNVSVDSSSDRDTVVVLESNTSHDGLSLSSPPIQVQSGMRLCLEAMCRKAPGFRGSLAVVISLVRSGSEQEDRRMDQFVVKEPNWDKGDGWLMAKQTFEIPSGGTSIRYHIRGKFVGKADLRGLSLVRRP